MFEVRGVVIRRVGTDKFVKVVAQVAYTDIYKVIEKKANVPIDKDVILNYASSHYGLDKKDIRWPHHLEVRDID